MFYTIQLNGEAIGPATVEEIQRRLGGRKLTGLEPVTFHSRMGDNFGRLTAYPELKRLLTTDQDSEASVGSKPYTPNHIPLRSRAAAIFLIIVGVFILYHYISTGETMLSASKHGPKLLVKGLWGLQAIAFFGGAVSAGLALVIDHYDRRPNERTYKVWISASMIAMITGKVSAIAVIHHLQK